MNARWMLSTAAWMAALFCAAALATAGESAIGQIPPVTHGPEGVIQNMSLVGIAVSNPQGQSLGQIKHVLLNPESGQATFVILDAESSGSGHAMLVVPYQALRVSFDAKDNRVSVVLGLRPDQVRAAPRIVNDQWQLLQNPQFLYQARDFYHVRAAYYAGPPSDAANVPSMASQPVPCPLPQQNTGTDLPQDLIDFYNE